MSQTLNDVFHYFGGDIQVSSTGDLQPVDTTLRGQQRILRRLLTNPSVRNADGTVEQGDYIWHPEYGAGLPKWIGRLKDEAKIKALILGQMMLEDAVAKLPEPTIELQDIPDGIFVLINYVDAPTQTPQVLSFNVTI
jgi:hypothetical protein